MEFNILNSPSDTTLHLTTLGRLTIAGEGDEVAALARQRRKLAVLVVLALSGQPRSREALAEMFWGEEDEERARHSLSEALSHIRRVLGRDSIATRLSEISLSSKAPLSIDAVDFERHIRTGDLAAAIERYAGSFLDGVHVEASSSFEQWADERRAYFERLFVKAAGQHCQSLARSRQWDDCAAVAERWLSFTPLSADAALYLLNARKADGTREALSRAVSEYERLRARLRREYETEPDAVVTSLARGIADEVERMPPSVINAAPVPVSPVAESTTPAAPGRDGDELRPHVGAPAEQRTSSTWWRIGAAAAATLLLGLVIAIAQRRDARVAAASVTPARIAVVPFTHIGSDSATEYLTAGMTDEVSVALGSVDGVRVLPATSVALDSGTVDVPALGRRLGADAVLTGSVRAEGDSARILVRLIGAQDGVQLWAGRFDRRSAAAAGVQEEIARAIALALRDRLSPGVGTVAERSAVDPETYDLYLRGRYFENRSGEPNLRRAMDYYQRALVRDSGFAPAYAGLAAAQMTLFGWGSSYAETVPLARANADRAVSLDPSLGAAHYVLGRLDWYDWRWADSEREFLMAIAANPSDARSHHMLSHSYLATGKLAESLAESRKALELEPLNPRMGLHLCVHYMMARQFGDALAACQRGIELDPVFPDAHAKLALLHLYSGRNDLARVEIEREMSVAGRIPLYLSQLAIIEAAAGHTSAAREQLAALHASETPARLPLFYIAAVHVQLGEPDSAMIRLEEAYANHSSEMDGLLLDPLFDPLRRDARFTELLHKLGEK